MKKLMITVGGTGGHVFPALTLAKQLLALDPKIEILFVGGGLSKNRYFEQRTFTFKDVSCGTLPLSKPIKALKNTFKIGKGIWESRKIIRGYSPDLIVGFGSYHTLPTLLAAKSLKVPILLHEANRIPGKVNRLLAPYVALTGVHFPDTAKRLRGNVLEVSIPLREGYHKGSTSKESAKKHFNLAPDLPVVLIFGGSQGAQAVNKLVADAAIGLSQKVQILQFTGDAATAKELGGKYASHGIQACVKEFETRMDLAWQAADLSIIRSGAVTMAEELEFEVPGILIPYPHAADNHQESNADFMVDVIGGGIKRLEKGLTAQILNDDIAFLLADDSKKLKAMHRAMGDYKKTTRPRELCVIVKEMLNKGVI